MIFVPKKQHVASHFKIPMFLSVIGNYPIKKCLHRSFLFQLRESTHHNLIHDLAPPKMKVLKYSTCNVVEVFKNNKNGCKNL